MKAPETLEADLELRTLLLSFFLETLTGPELADWLRDIDRDAVRSKRPSRRADRG